MIRLRDVAAVDPPTPGFGLGDVGARMSFLPLERVWHDGRFDPTLETEFDGDPRSYTRVLEGDVLVPKVAPTFAHGRVAIARGLRCGRALATSEVFVVRTGDRAAARFLQYRLQAKDFVTEGVASWTGVAGLKRISAEFLRNVRIDHHAWASRGLVADLLDVEISRTDAAVERAKVLQRLVDERLTAVRERLLVSVPRPALVPLRRLASVQTGLTLNARLGSSVGLGTDRPYLRVANVQPGSLDLMTVKRVDVNEDQIRRHSLMPGDVLMTEGGDRDKLGRGVVWHGEVAGALHQNHVFAVRPRSGVLLPEFLEMVLASVRARRYFEATANQTTNLASTNTTIVGALRVPLPPIAEQQRIVVDFAHASGRHLEIAAQIDRQISLLAERREALIAAAVTGHLRVPESKIVSTLV